MAFINKEKFIHQQKPKILRPWLFIYNVYYLTYCSNTIYKVCVAYNSISFQMVEFDRI